MPQWCIAYGCKNSSDMEIKKSWHRLPLENKELLSKWLAKIRRTNTPVNEHSRLCGDHFEADCFKNIPGSSRINLKPGSIPTKFCFVQEKTPRKLPMLVRENSGRSVRPSAIFFHKAVLGGNMNSSRIAVASPPSIPSFRRFLAMFSPLFGSMRSLSRPPQ